MENNKKIDSLFVSTLYYGINKSIINIVGTGGKALGRRTSVEMINLLKELGILKENMTNDEIKNLFVNDFGLSENLNIIENENEIIFEVINPTLDLFLGKLMEEQIEPFVCPFIHLLSSIYEETHNTKLMLKEVIPEQNKASIIFKKVN